MRRAWPAVLCLCAAACGYRFTAGPGGLPQGIRTLQAPVFANQSSEPNLEAVFTQAFREQLVRRGAAGGADAEGRVDGKVLSVGSSATLVGTNQVSVQVLLTLSRDGQVLASTQVGDSEEYLRASDPALTEANRQAALRRLAETLMREGYERLASGW